MALEEVRKRGHLVEIHYVENPYVIFVSTLENKYNKDAPQFFSQIGITNILPIALENETEPTREISTYWSPKTTQFLKKCFSESVEIYYLTSHLHAEVYGVSPHVPSTFGKLYLLRENNIFDDLANILCDNQHSIYAKQQYYKFYKEKILVEKIKPSLLPASVKELKSQQIQRNKCKKSEIPHTSFEKLDYFNRKERGNNSISQKTQLSTKLPTGKNSHLDQKSKNKHRENYNKKPLVEKNVPNNISRKINLPQKSTTNQPQTGINSRTSNFSEWSQLCQKANDSIEKSSQSSKSKPLLFSDHSGVSLTSNENRIDKSDTTIQNYKNENFPTKSTEKPSKASESSSRIITGQENLIKMLNEVKSKSSPGITSLPTDNFDLSNNSNSTGTNYDTDHKCVVLNSEKIQDMKMNTNITISIIPERPHSENDVNQSNELNNSIHNEDDPELSFSEDEVERNSNTSHFSKLYCTDGYISELEKKSRNEMIKDVCGIEGSVPLNEIKVSDNSIACVPILNSNEKMNDYDDNNDLSVNVIDENFYKSRLIPKNEGSIDDSYDYLDQVFMPKLMLHTKLKKLSKRWLHFNDVKFHSNVFDNLKLMNLKKIAPSQTVCWPAVTEEFNPLLIGPKKSGKTLGLLAPVCNFISIPENVNALPKSYGPLIWIVCLNQASADYVEFMCRALLRGVKFNNEDHAIIRIDNHLDALDVSSALLNGCSVLISTPALYKVINDDFFDMKRLLFLVFENVDELIADNEDKVLGIYKKCLAQEIRILATSKKWNSFMYYMSITLKNPLICINAFLECAKYSNVNVKTLFIRSSDKMNTFITNFNDIMKSANKVVILCNDIQEIQLLADSMKDYDYNIIKQPSKMMNWNQINDIKTEWESCNVSFKTILMCCDEFLTWLNIFNAEYLIHYSLADSFVAFNERFVTIINSVPSVWQPEAKSGPGVLIFIDETNIVQIPRIVNFLEDIGCTVDEKIKKYSKQLQKEKDLEKAKSSVPFCHNSFYGKCPDPYYCSKRHFLSLDYDKLKDRLPQCGHIDFKIIYMHNVCHYTARLLSSTDVHGKKTDYNQTDLDLQMRIYTYYLDDKKKVYLRKPKVNDICAIEVKPDLYMRCQIVSVLSTDEKANPTSFLIKLIDTLEYIKWSAKSLLPLCEEFHETNDNIIEIILVGFKPCIGEWDNGFVKKLGNIYSNFGRSAYFNGRIRFAYGRTYLIDSAEIRQAVLTTDKVVVKNTVKDCILRNGIGVKNDSHELSVQNLYKDCSFDYPVYEEAQVVQSEEVQVIKSEEVKFPEPQWAFLNADEVNEVIFSFGIDPSTFFLRIEKFDSCLKMLQKDIKKYVDDFQISKKALLEPKINQYYLVRYSDFDFYRCRIVDVIKKENAELEYKCFFADYGDILNVSAQDILPITPKLITQMPFQAIECRLLGIQPICDRWSDASIDYLFDACYVNDTDDDIVKSLLCKTSFEETSSLTSSKRYVVVLHESSLTIGETLNESFATRNFAKVLESEDNALKKIKNELADYLDNLEKDEQHDSDLDDVDFDSSKINDINTRENEGEMINPDDFGFTEEDVQCCDDDEDILCTFTHEDLIRMTSGNTNRGVELFEVPSDANTSNLESYFPNNPEVAISTLPSLNCSGGFLDYKKPFVSWKETLTHVYFKIELIGVEDCKIKIETSHFFFECELGDDVYKLDFELFNCVHVEQCSYFCSGLYISVKLEKLYHKIWKSLTRDEEKVSWLKYDYDNLDEEKEDPEEEELQEFTPKEIAERMNIGYYDSSDSEDSFDDVCDVD